MVNVLSVLLGTWLMMAQTNALAPKFRPRINVSFARTDYVGYSPV